MKPKRQTKREAKRLFRTCLVNGLLDESRTRQIVNRIIRTKRRGGLALLSQFRRLVKLACARHTAKIESAVPLPVELREGIQSSLKRTYGPGISTSFTQNPGLVAGLRVQVGSDVYDGSVQARLAALEKGF